MAGPRDPTAALDEGPAFRSAIELIGGKWTASVLLAGGRGARRFVEYRAAVEGISDRLLSQRLRQLEEQGLVERLVVASTPVQVSYRPTATGRSLIRALQPLVSWSQEQGPGHR